MQEENFFVDMHYYGAKYLKTYNKELIRKTHKIIDYKPFCRIPLAEVGYLSNCDEAIKAIDECNLSYFKEIHLNDPSMPGIKFLLPQLNYGDAIISPDGTTFIIVTIDDYEEEINFRNQCKEKNIQYPYDWHYPILNMTHDKAIIEVPCDNELRKWINKNYGPWIVK